MKPNDRKTWLASLKVGDEVTAIRNGRDEWPNIVTLTHADPARGFRWYGGRTVDPCATEPNGRRTTSGHGSVAIYPVTDAHRQAVADRNALANLERVRWCNVPIDQRRRIAAILDETDKDASK